MKGRLLATLFLFLLALLMVGCFPEVEPVTKAPPPTADRPVEATALPTATELVDSPAVVPPVATETPAPSPLPTETPTPQPSPTKAPAGPRYFTGGAVAYEGVSFTYAQHEEFTFEGYVLPGAFHQPGIYVYPAEEFADGNRIAAPKIAGMRQLLAEKTVELQESIPFQESIPLLPLFNAGQMMRSQFQYLDFQNGEGVRYLTQLGQAYLPINNREMFYTFQGLTDDGGHYVAAILPVAHPILPADETEISGGDAEAFIDNFDAYVQSIEQQLDGQDPASFQPDLAQLDALMGSLQVKTGPTALEPRVLYDYSDWQSTTNERFGYAVMYPGDVTVVEAGDGTGTSFEGPLSDNERWPSISINHYDSSFYHPPAGADVSQWVADFGIPHDQIGQSTEIGGLPATHLIVKSTPQSYGFDEYYFIKDEQLFRILILHTGGKQDWDLYDQFLQGFAFEEDLDPDGNIVEAWQGSLGRYPTGLQSSYFFDRNDGQRFVVGGLDEAVTEQIDQAAWQGDQVELWGELAKRPGFIDVSRLEQLAGPGSEARNLSPFATASASSELPADRLGTYQAWSAVDGELDSPWCEGATRTGTGEWIQLEFPSPIQLTHLIVANGYDYDEDVFRNNNRVKNGRFVFSDGEVEWEFEDKRGPQLVDLEGRLFETTLVKLVVDEAYPGSKYDDTCVAEIEVWGRPK
jgi:hypothetical protein